MIKGSAVILNSNGIHVRPSRVISTEAASLPGEIILHANDITVTPVTIINLLALGLKQGDQVDIMIQGTDNDQVLKRLVELFETHFDFPAADSDCTE